jgi:hypothetical protein
MARAWRLSSGIARCLVLSAIWLGVVVGPLAPPTRADEAPATAAPCAPIAATDGTDQVGLVPFQSLTQGNVFDHGPPSSLLVVSAKPEPISLVVAPSAAPTISGVDFTTDVLVGLFIGRWPQEGHRVAIESVRVTDDGVCLTATVSGPAPGQDAADAETYPYHVVTVARSVVPQAPGTAWTVVSPDGTVLATTKFP